MRISDWSSDVCSSDLVAGFDVGGNLRVDLVGAQERPVHDRHHAGGGAVHRAAGVQLLEVAGGEPRRLGERARGGGDRKSVVSGKSVSVRVDLGGSRIIKKKNNKNYISTTNKAK